MKKRIFQTVATLFLFFCSTAAFAQHNIGDEPPAEGSHVVLYVNLGILGLVAAVIFGASVFTVKQNNVRIRERFGKFVDIKGSGLGFKLPIIHSMSPEIFLGLEQLEISLETKTKDNVFVELSLTIQKRINPAKVKEMYYELSDPEAQIDSFVNNVIRAEVPKMTLDQLFEKKDEIATTIKDSLEDQMSKYGFDIESTQINDINPDEKVKEAMNSVQASERNREAAQNNAEAAKIAIVKAAEARKEADILHGEGIAGQRQAIATGAAKAISILKDADPLSTERDINRFILTAQYMDTIKEIGASGKNSTIFLPSSPGGLVEVMTSIMGGNLGTKSAGEQPEQKG